MLSPLHRPLLCTFRTSFRRSSELHQFPRLLLLLQHERAQLQAIIAKRVESSDAQGLNWTISSSFASCGRVPVKPSRCSAFVTVSLSCSSVAFLGLVLYVPRAIVPVLPQPAVLCTVSGPIAMEAYSPSELLSSPLPVPLSSLPAVGYALLLLLINARSVGHKLVLQRQRSQFLEPDHL